MKILLDENIPSKVKLDFGTETEVKTVRDMNWQGKKNGELLGLMVINGFDIFITVDKNLQYQQNLEKFDLTIFLLLAINNKHQTLQPLMKNVQEMLSNKDYNKFNVVQQNT